LIEPRTGKRRLGNESVNPILTLVLSRKRGESIVIGNEITVTVLEVQGDRIKLGFTASAEVPIHRQEIYRAVRASPPAFAYAECS